MRKRDVKLETLDDIETEFKKSSNNIRKAHSRKKQGHTAPTHTSYTPHDAGKRRSIIFGIVLITVLVIVASFSVVYRRHADEEAAIEASIKAEEDALTLASVQAETEAAAAQGLQFVKSEDEALIAAVDGYFNARMNADTSRIYAMFGRKDTTANADFAEKLKAQASWIQAYQSIAVYTVPGLNDNENFCIATYEIDFRRTDALAYGIIYFYAVRDEAGNITFVENLMKDRVDYAEAALQTESAKTLIDDTNAKLRESLETNSTLALIYVSFENGTVYSDTGINYNAEQNVDIFLNPEDSVLVDDSVLQDIAAEAQQAAALEASQAAGDVYETNEFPDDPAESNGTDVEPADNAGPGGDAAPGGYAGPGGDAAPGGNAAPGGEAADANAALGTDGTMEVIIDPGITDGAKP